MPAGEKTSNLLTFRSLKSRVGVGGFCVNQLFPQLKSNFKQANLSHFHDINKLFAVNINFF